MIENEDAGQVRIEWSDMLSQVNWENVRPIDKEKFEELVIETRDITLNNLVAEVRYQARLRTLFFSMAITLGLALFNYSHNYMVVSMILFHIIITAFSGIISLGSESLAREAEVKMMGTMRELVSKYPANKKEKAEDET